MAHDTLTFVLRCFLKEPGYKVYGWDLGVNTGFSPEVADDLQKLLSRIYFENNEQRISIIGWSLGGVYAKFLAFTFPFMIRNVISLGSPFDNIREGVHPLVLKIYNMMAPIKMQDVYTEQMAELLRMSPPIPTTSVFSKTDGVVAPCCCHIDEPGDLDENIEVVSSHVGLAWNPLVAYVLADRLSQPEDNWKKFDKSGLRKYFYK